MCLATSRSADYIVSKVYFESLPGFFVTGNLYRPIGDGPFPAILSPHGHWAYGRLENSATASVPGRAINLARQGFVVFTYDMIGYNDSWQLEHRSFGGTREKLWGLSMAGLQLWNGIRGLDFLESLPYVQRDKIGATGASGGGTQVFLLAAVDQRVAVAAPVNMISLHMQGGCLCENQPGLRLDTTNVEIAATIAPRPLLMVSATGDWTTNTLEREYPAVRALYALQGAADRVHAVRFEAPHNYNQRVARGRLRVDGPLAAERARERAPRRTLLHARPASRSDGLLQAPGSAERRRRREIDVQLDRSRAGPVVVHAARDTRASAEAGSRVWASASFIAAVAPPAAEVKKRGRRRQVTVIVAGIDADLEKELRSARFILKPVDFTPFDAAEAAKIPHFDTYNRTAASQRVADIVEALRATPDAVFVGSGDAALAGLLALTIETGRRGVLDIGEFDTSNDAAFVERLYMPGLRRAGDLSTAASLVEDRAVIHNAGPSFMLNGAPAPREKMSAKEIVALLKQ